MLSDQSRTLGDGRRSTRAQKSAKPKAAKAGPRFIFVNDRTPRGHAHCASCCEPLSASYVREIATGLIYCNQRCSARRSRRMSDIASQFRAWVVS
jgi:hypothetical protein